MIHQYKMFDQNIVLDICSGSIHVVDEIAYDMIAEFLDKDKKIIAKRIDPETIEDFLTKMLERDQMLKNKTKK